MKLTKERLFDYTYYRLDSLFLLKQIKQMDDINQKLLYVYCVIYHNNDKDFFTLQSNLSLVDEYLSNIFIDSIDQAEFTFDSYSLVRKFLPKTNQIWNDYFNSLRLLKKLL